MSPEDIDKKISKDIKDRLDNFTFELGEHLAQTVNGAVKLAVQEKVNGKIDTLSQKLDIYVINDTAWKTEIQPLLDSYKNVKWLGKLLLGTAVGVGTIAGAVITVIKLFKL